MMKFSVLLSVYYKENPDFLKQSLDSILNQSRLPDELVLVKDGQLSIDLDRMIDSYVRKYTDLFKILALSENQGLGKALDVGLKYCTFDVVARMDTDDIATPNRFERQITVFEKYPELDVVGAWISEFENVSSNVVSIRKLPEYHNEIYLYAKKRCPINHPVVMFKKDAVFAAGGYRHFPLFEDYYLWVRMLMNGAKFYNIQESLLAFRFSSEMFKRRGGLKYAISELNLQREFARMGFINCYELFRNVTIRFVSRLIPNKVREFVYLELLR